MIQKNKNKIKNKKESTKNSSNSALKFNAQQLYIIPCGGCGEFGMNLTAYIYNAELYIVDAGTLFPPPQLLGVQSIYPSIESLVQHFKGVKAYLITHGHEDHIGAMPYLLKSWPAPVYCTPWTQLLLKKKFEKTSVNVGLLKQVKPGETVGLSGLKVQFIHVNHSIPDACALWITTSQASIFHTGDFKIDPTPPGAKSIDLKRIAEIGKKGVDLLITDSTNAHCLGPSLSEQTVVEPLKKIISQAEGRTILTTFASNFWRLRIIAEITHQLGKKICLLGHGINVSFEIAEKLGYYKIPKGVLVDPKKANTTADKKLVVLASGSQAESNASIARIALGEHQHFALKPKDLFVFSARMIPGNERNINKLMDVLKKHGAEVITTHENSKIHVSGHAFQKDLETLIELTRPRYYIPVHGSYTHMAHNLEIAENYKNSQLQKFLVENGDILSYQQKKLQKIGSLSLGQVFVDSGNRSFISWDSLQDRLQIGELGSLVLTGLISTSKKNFVKGPDFQTIGVDISDKKWKNQLNSQLSKTVSDWLKKNTFKEELLEAHICKFVSQFLFHKLRRKPVLISKLYFL